MKTPDCQIVAPNLVTDNLVHNNQVQPHTGRMQTANSICLNLTTEQDWNLQIQKFQDAVIQNTPAYSHSRWPRAKLEHVTVSIEDELIAAAQVMVLAPPLLPGGLAIVQYGPLWQLDSRSAEHLTNYRLAVAALKKEYVVKRKMMLRIRPQADALNQEAITAVLNSEGLLNNNQFNADRFLVDLSSTTDEVRAGFGSKWRYNLKKSEKNDLEFKLISEDNAVSSFMTLYEEMYSRKKFHDDSSINELPQFYTELPLPLKPLVFECTHNGNPVSAAVISIIGDTAIYLFGASTDSALSLRAGYFLHWGIIQWLHENRANTHWYDLGGGANNAGLVQFKSGMVGKNGEHIQMPGEYECAEHPINRFIITNLLKLRDKIGNNTESETG